jgi:hypothetical protein
MFFKTKIKTLHQCTDFVFFSYTLNQFKILLKAINRSICCCGFMHSGFLFFFFFCIIRAYLPYLCTYLQIYATLMINLLSAHKMQSFLKGKRSIKKSKNYFFADFVTVYWTHIPNNSVIIVIIYNFSLNFMDRDWISYRR